MSEMGMLYPPPALLIKISSLPPVRPETCSTQLRIDFSSNTSRVRVSIPAEIKLVIFAGFRDVAKTRMEGARLWNDRARPAPRDESEQPVMRTVRRRPSAGVVESISFPLESLSLKL